MFKLFKKAEKTEFKSVVVNSSERDVGVCYKEPKTIRNLYDLDCFIYDNCRSVDFYVAVWYQKTNETFIFVGDFRNCVFLKERMLDGVVDLNGDNFNFIPFNNLSLSFLQ
jgi:hypothetical protein